MKDWKWRLQDVLEKYSYNGIKNIEEYSEICEVVEQELDKAREEVRIETLKEVEYALEEGIRYKHGIRFTEIQEVLSKLKDNKQWKKK